MTEITMEIENFVIDFKKGGGFQFVCIFMCLHTFYGMNRFRYTKSIVFFSHTTRTQHKFGEFKDFQSSCQIFNKLILAVR